MSLSFFVIIVLVFVVVAMLLQHDTNKIKERNRLEELDRVDALKRDRENQEVQIRIAEENKRAEEEKRAAREAYYAFLVTVVTEHISTLLRKKSTLVRVGDYGEVLLDDWVSEIKRFLSIMDPESTWRNIDLEYSDLLNFIHKKVSEEKLRSNLEDTLSVTEVNDLSGDDFEIYCASLFESEGWTVRRLPLIGDQGVDLIVEKGERCLAVQCKRYSTPVGNKAVQEVYTGMGFYDANEAIVISNNSYTKSAQELANKLGVGLLHYEEIKNL